MQAGLLHHLVLEALLQQHDAQDNIRGCQDLLPQVQAGAGGCHTGERAQHSCCHSDVRVCSMLTQRLCHMLSACFRTPCDAADQMHHV